MCDRISVFFLLFLLPVIGSAQSCDLKLSGYLKDLESNEPLENAYVYLNEAKRGMQTDSSGFFQFEQLCDGQYHIVLSHVGCESQRIFVALKSDTLLKIGLEHNHKVLNRVLIKKKITTTQNSEVINQQQITDQANENLSNLLEEISGVSTLRNGNGIAKPVVHGLYGNRITILNNGIAQSGQQWGNDHSPEIDPLVANRIRVIKGVSALAYPGSSLGSVILVEPQKINREPHLHGKATYFFESNGRGHGGNIQLQQHTPVIAWKVNGTLKKSGDRKSPTYFLNNTGSNEANLALQLEKSISERFFVDAYLSTFNTTLGVLRGSHIGNVTDLSEALRRDVPFYTEQRFSYNIDAPKQRVNHHLGKIHAKYFFDEQKVLDFTIAAQLNRRKEFDVRRSGRTDIPAMSLEQYTYYAEGKYKQYFKKDLTLSVGLQFNMTDNTNDPETGILPLIPDYFSYETGVYAVIHKQISKSFFELGIRYDNNVQDVTAISRSLPRRLLFYENTFHNVSATAGWTYRVNRNWQLTYNLGYAMRNPAINELYSSGLHQGVSGIEEGNTNLLTEKAVKTTLSVNADFDHDVSFEGLVYYQGIQDYIYLQPQSKFRSTIRGAFPLFFYEQTNAQIYGFDLSAKWRLIKGLHLKGTYSYIRGKDRSNALPLINIPANNAFLNISYEFAKGIKIGAQQLENLELTLENKYIFRQNNLLPEQDFILPPNAYNLLGFRASTDIQLGKTRMRIFTGLDNVLNEIYRDYLNRQRYFANDLGRNFKIGFSLRF